MRIDTTITLSFCFLRNLGALNSVIAFFDKLEATGGDFYLPISAVIDGPDGSIGVALTREHSTIGFTAVIYPDGAISLMQWIDNRPTLLGYKPIADADDWAKLIVDAFAQPADNQPVTPDAEPAA